ncbi:hypothetical protein [Methanobrevibacter sp.]
MCGRLLLSWQTSLGRVHAPFVIKPHMKEARVKSFCELKENIDCFRLGLP